MISGGYIVEAEKLYCLKDNEVELRKYIEENLNLEVFNESAIKEIIAILNLNENKDFVIGKVAGFLAVCWGAVWKRDPKM